MDYRKDLTLFYYAFEGMFVFLPQEEYEVWGAPWTLVWCVQQRNMSPNDIVAAGASQRSWSEIAEPMFLTLQYHHAAVWERKEITAMSGDSQFLARTVA